MIKVKWEDGLFLSRETDRILEGKDKTSRRSFYITEDVSKSSGWKRRRKN